MRAKVLEAGVLVLAGLALGTFGGGWSWAGPARYDAETRSIRMTYTFAALAEGLYGEAAIGAPQTPTSEQDANVRTIVLKVSDALSKATSGRLQIASLDMVPDVKRADVVISLTGNPGRGGWAITGAIEGRPGQVGLYYATLANEWEQDYVLTAAHEVCHYIFGFVDEYNFPNGCPQANPGGPGCLMDNYLSLGTRHGWYGRFCSADHYADPSQPSSCQEIADKFFRDRGVTTNGAADPASVTAAAVAANQSKSVIDNITRAAIGKVREEVEARNKGKSPGAALTSVTALRGFARKFLESQLKLNQIGLSSEEVSNLVDAVLKQAAGLVRIAIPPQFGPIVNIIARLADMKAKELREKYPNDSEITRRQKIVRALLAFVSGLGSSAPTVDGPITAEERRYLEHVALLAASQTDEQKLNSELYSATLAYIKLERETARNVLDIASEAGVVGIEKRLAALGEVDADLRKFLPGRTASSGTGLRRTIIIDPDPIDPRADVVITQAGISRYADLRDQYVELFQKLVERAKIELLTTELQQRRLKERREMLAKPNMERARQERLRRIAELADRGKVRAQREADLRALVNELISQVRRNRLENIVFLVPPGGLDADLKSLFEALRRQLIVKGDVRLDLVLVGAPDVPAELRDIAVGTGGSVVTLSDIDEVGAVAQRLKNDQTSGAWVVVPQQGVIRGRFTGNDSGARAADALPWLVEDPRRGQFLHEPISDAYCDVKLWCKVIDNYFAAPDGDANMLKANALPPEPIRMLSNAVRQSLRDEPAPGGPGERDEASMGLLSELGYLRDLVLNFNRRPPGAGDELRFEIIEHLIRARSHHAETRALLRVALKAHEKLVAPDFKEDAVFQHAYDEVKQKNGDIGQVNITPSTPGATPTTPGQPAIVPPPAPQPAQDHRPPAAVPAPGTGEVRKVKPSGSLLNDPHPAPVSPVGAAEVAPAVPADNSECKEFQGTTSAARLLNLVVAGLETEADKYRNNATTTAYIRLRQQEVRLRLVDDFLHHIETEVASWDKTPMFRRIDRRALMQANQRIQDNAIGVVPVTGGLVARRPLPPVDTVDDMGNAKLGAVRLPRFYAENQKFDPAMEPAEFELIIGFAQPLPLVDIASIRECRSDVLPELRLYNDNGQLVNTPSLKLDRDMSSPTCLVYRFSPEFSETGWYTAALILGDETFRRLTDPVDYTFSVASTRPNFRLTAVQVQVPSDPELVPPPPNRGLARVMDRRVKVEVQVYGGTSVRGASIRGVLHKLDAGTGPINPIAQDFHDDGKTYGDLKANDGIYTSIIALDQIDQGMEYRLLIQAESTEASRNIAPEDPGENDKERRATAIAAGVKDVRAIPAEEVKTPEPQKAVVFQRATSIQIRVER